MIPIYINHYKPLVERKKYLDAALNGVSEVKWITEPDRSDIDDNITKEWYLPSEKIWKERCKNYYDTVPDFRIQKAGDIACSLGHINAWKIFTTTHCNLGLFLEDDIILCDNFYQNLNIVCENIPSDLDVLFIGGGFNHTVAPTKLQNGNFILKDNPSTNCLCSYLITKNAAIKLLNVIKPFTLPIDFEANYWFDKLKFNVYHHIPYIAKEGSSLGIYKSTQTR